VSAAASCGPGPDPAVSSLRSSAEVRAESSAGWTGTPLELLRPGSVTNPIRVWNACEPLFSGEVIARTTERPCAAL